MAAHSSESRKSTRFAADLHRERSSRSFVTLKISLDGIEARDRTNMTGADPGMDCPP
jgi:hypothetical protein